MSDDDIGKANTELPEHSADRAARAERKANEALRTLNDRKNGVVPRLERVEDALESLGKKAPPVVAIWTIVVCAVVVALQSFVSLVGR